MGKVDLLAGSDSEGEQGLNINENYASRYSKWRRKEELVKLQNVFGPDATLSCNSETSEDDEDAKDLPAFEKYFFTALSCLKKKDPRVFDTKYNFAKIIDENSKQKELSDTKVKKEKPLFLRDYERKLIVEKNGILSDDEEQNNNENNRASSPTYVEQQRALKASFKEVLENSDDENDEKLGSLFQKKVKTAAEEKKEEEDYREWLKGRKKSLKDKETKSDLKGLYDYWNDPNLDADEMYLKDYILNKRFLGEDDGNFVPKFNETVHDDDDDEENLEKQEEFERKYNFRFEEPDPEFIKRYPREMESSVRRKDDRRKRKRQEIRERKEAEMAAKREKIKQLKALKRKEILEKIEKIKEVTGNDVDFDDEDLEGDFDPQKYDEKMKEIFNADYYGVEEEEVPEFHDLDDYLEIENWDEWNKNDSNIPAQSGFNQRAEGVPECEDPNFNMDCDYDPKVQFQQELMRTSKSKKKQRRKSKLAMALATEKPVFDPNKQKFEEYFDEYYKLDCEDIIGDLPCRFKYRKTTPNDYGLTVDEILRADVKELNKWCSLKKVVKYKPEHVEANEVKIYKMKARNEALKKKILPSLYAEPQEDFNDMESEKAISVNVKKNKKKKEKEPFHNSLDNELFESDVISKESGKKKKKKKKSKEENGGLQDTSHSEPSTKKRKYNVEHKNLTEKSVESERLSGQECYPQNPEGKVKNKQFNKKYNSLKIKSSDKNRQNSNKTEPSIPLSDVRLKAYGVRPKKFKNKIKYGNYQPWNNS